MAAELTKKSTSLGIELLQIGTSFSFCAEQNLATWPRFPAHSESLKKWVIDICDKALPFLREDLGSGRACWDHPCIVRLLLVGALEHLDYFSEFFPSYWIYWEQYDNHPNWRAPSFFRGVGIPPTRLSFIWLELFQSFISFSLHIKMGWNAPRWRTSRAHLGRSIMAAN